MQIRKPIILDEAVRRVAEGMLSTPPASIADPPAKKVPSRSARTAARRPANKSRGKTRKTKRSR